METKYPFLPDVYSDNCPSRRVLDRLADKWTVLIVAKLAEGTQRFGELRRAIQGISPKVLTQTLRSLERDGIVDRRMYATIPPKVEYSLTPLGHTLVGLVEAIRDWAEQHIDEVEAAQRQFDARAKEEEVLEV
jgi:DNA-binding HxlR family transcriptional regulator